MLLLIRLVGTIFYCYLFKVNLTACTGSGVRLCKLI